MSEMLTLDRFEEASEIVKKVTQETKLVYSEYLSEQTGNKVYLKPENMQFTGAYKSAWCLLQDQHIDRRRASAWSDHRIRRKSCTGCGLCGKTLWCKGNHRNANYNTTD